MCVSGIRNRLVVLVSFFIFMSILLISARGQDQRPAAKRESFEIPFTSPNPYQKWLDEDVRWIITDEERAEYTKLATDQQRDHFVEDFWERRNPTPGSAENRFKEEHYRRLAYANQSFAAGVPGWKTDRGRVYIVYGPPDEREEYPGRTTPSGATGSFRQQFSSEIWRYNFIKGLGHGVFFVFLDTCGCGEYVLQHNARSQISILYGSPDWVDYHYSDAISNCENVSTVKGPIDWEVWHYRFIESIGKDIGFGFSDACDHYGKFEGPIFWQGI